ncbi:MAG: TIGR01777 family oxidoreductase [Elusimicrobia bacterium]|nr:TIGR01777 family oxidoreductase [Elusimicrobiota bacterium]
MRVLLAGGDGFIGRYLAWSLAERGHEVVLLSRRAGPRRLLWDGASVRDSWLAEAQTCAAWINLCGEPIAAARWTKRRKKKLAESRLRPAAALVSALEGLKTRPKVLLNASAVGYYGDSGERVVDETHSRGAGFLPELCEAWERQAMRASELGVRVVCLRIGPVLGPGGGLLGRLVPPFRAFLGATLGGGRQWLPWISRTDFAGLAAHLLQAEVSGPVNAVGPNPVTNEGFSVELARTLGRPCFLRVPAFALRLALGEMADVLLQGQRAVPKKALDSGFSFKHRELAAALRDELQLPA